MLLRAETAEDAEIAEAKNFNVNVLSLGGILRVVNGLKED